MNLTTPDEWINKQIDSLLVKLQYLRLFLNIHAHKNNLLFLIIPYLHPIFQIF